jgi:hypothetical protein
MKSRLCGPCEEVTGGRYPGCLTRVYDQIAVVAGRWMGEGVSRVCCPPCVVGVDVPCRKHWQGEEVAVVESHDQPSVRWYAVPRPELVRVLRVTLISLAEVAVWVVEVGKMGSPADLSWR